MHNKKSVQSSKINQNKAYSHDQSGLLAIHTAVLLFGLSGVIGKSLDLPAVIITFARVLISAIFLFLILISKKDALTDGTARQILAHNETWAKNCEKQ